MIKYLQIILFFGLIFLSSYLYLDKKNAIELFNKKIAVLEASSKKYQEDCETRIAYLKAEKDRQEAKRKIQNENPSIRNILDKLSVNPEKLQQNTLNEMVAILKLDEKQEMQIRAIVADFEKNKDQIFEKGTRDKVFIMSPEHQNMINKARREAMEKLSDILTEEQQNALKKNDFDKKLGLRDSQHSAATLQ